MPYLKLHKNHLGARESGLDGVSGGVISRLWRIPNQRHLGCCCDFCWHVRCDGPFQTGCLT